MCPKIRNRESEKIENENETKNEGKNQKRFSGKIKKEYLLFFNVEKSPDVKSK